MAATVQLRITYGAAPGTVEEKHALNIPLLSSDVGADGVNPSDHPIQIPSQVGETNYSYERYIQFYVADIDTSLHINNIRFFTDSTELIPGSTLYAQVKSKDSYTAPVDTDEAGSTVAEGSIVPTTEAEAVSITVPDDGNLTTGEYSNFLVLQLALPYGSTNSGGSTNIYFVYDEVA